MTLSCGDELGTLTVDDIQLVGGDPRWCAYDLTVFADGRNHRGADDLIPGIDGVVTNPRRFSPTTYLIPFAITGRVNAAGDDLGREGQHRRCMAHVTEARELLIATDRIVVWNFTEGTWTGAGHILDLDRRDYGDGIWDGFLEFLLTEPWETT